MRKTYIETGKIVTTHGIRGEVKVYPWCDDLSLFEQAGQLYLDSQGKRPVRVQAARQQKSMVLLKLEGIDTMEQAAALRDRILYIHRDEIPLEEGEYLIQDLMGLEVLDVDSQQRYGVLTDVSQTGANDVYHIRFADGKERLIPAIPQVVIRTDLEEERLWIRPLEGLFDHEN